MAKVNAPFTISGTIDDLNFYDSTDGNIVRMRGKTGITKQQFKDNPIFDPIRRQSSDFGYCSKKAKIFNLLVKPFYEHSQGASLFGRCIQLLLAILNEDTGNEKGNRSLVNGLQTERGLNFLLGFEGNTDRPLSAVMLPNVTFDWNKFALDLKELDPITDIVWPESATQVSIQLAIANWNCDEDCFETSYSSAQLIDKKSGVQSLLLDLSPPTEKHLWLCFIHFRFSYSIYNKVKILHNRNNSNTLIGYHIKGD
ncbi:hypothetical protein [Flavobacterium sp.]|uniref:hypothetical protein n=1 Tax=Flavobacterium sp. TaxID=239 RepID=UPI002D11D039|nr:hypothetical protein [Flavobacterium sp.]HSD07339.1 hypothetical protein [Flavobacterium sp.]